MIIPATLCSLMVLCGVGIADELAAVDLKVPPAIVCCAQGECRDCSGDSVARAPARLLACCEFLGDDEQREYRLKECDYSETAGDGCPGDYRDDIIWR